MIVEFDVTENSENKKLFEKYRNDFRLDYFMKKLVELKYGKGFSDYEFMSKVNYKKGEGKNPSYIKFDIKLFK